jgi:hypothetical protein
MKIMKEMKAQMGVLMELSTRQGEQNKALQSQMEGQAQFLSATMQAVREVQSQVTAMRNEFMDVFRGHRDSFESQAQRRHLEARRGDSTTPAAASSPGEKTRTGNSPVIPEVLPAIVEKTDSPPVSPPHNSLSPNLIVTQPPTTGGLGVFAEQGPSQAPFDFVRGPPGLFMQPDAQFKLAGRTPSKERDEGVDFNELTNLIISGDGDYLDAIKHATPKVLDKTDQDGMTAFHYAAMHGRAEACDAILSHPGFNATKVGDRNSNTAMHIAALHDQGDVCHVILRHDSSAATVKNHFGDSPCEIARRRGNARVCAAFQNLKE